MKVDLYNHEKRYASWKEHALKYGMDGLSKQNSKLLINYILDMEIGANVSSQSRKGPRSFHRLNNVRQKISKVFRMLQERGIEDVSKSKDTDIQKLFSDMEKGILKTESGTIYKATLDYAKGFKAFWHWWMKKNSREKKKDIPDITEYVDSSHETKPTWVYLDENQLKKIFESVTPNYAMLFEFLFDSGARPTETFSIRVKDIETSKDGVVSVNISDEVAKSIGRRIKLILCGKNLVKFIEDNKLYPDDYIFKVSSAYANWLLGQTAGKIFGNEESKAGEKYSKMSMYDLRHCSCCYWLQRYKTESALMYRFGWKSSKYIHYYSEFLGMKDPIRDEDLYVDITKTELERELGKQKSEIEELKEFKNKFGKIMEDLLSKKKSKDKIFMEHLSYDFPTNVTNDDE